MEGRNHQQQAETAMDAVKRPTPFDLDRMDQTVAKTLDGWSQNYSRRGFLSKLTKIGLGQVLSFL